MSEQSITELIDELNSDFSARQISNFLEVTGLLTSTSQYTVIQFEKYILLRGNQDEIYTLKERTFIEKTASIIFYSDYYKQMKSGYMPCRIIAVDLSSHLDDIYSAILFMKIVIKAIGGFTTFVIKLNDGIHLGIRIFNRDVWRNCTLSEPGKLSAVLEEASWVDEYEHFLKYYNILAEAIKPVSNKYIDYDEMVLKKRGVQAGYIDFLYEMESTYGESVQTELGRYQDSFDIDYKIDYAEILEGYLEELKNVQSLKVNTIEMLFEADELESTALDIEEQHSKMLEDLSDNSVVKKDFNMIEEMNSDPEAVIKRLKSIKGLV